MEQKLYTLNFWLLCSSSLLFSASFNMLIPELPSYLSSIGGAEYKGLIIALFTLTAGISRPFSGKLTDTIGRVPVMAVGSSVCFICGFLYPILSSVSGFLFLRLLHGFSTGFKPTATAAYVADIAPSSRWGEALGIHGLFFSTGMAIGPAIGSAITASYSIDTLFYCSSLLAFLSIGILLNLKETLAKKQRFSSQSIKITKNDIIDLRVFPAAFVTLLSYFAYGTILTLIPDWSEYIGLKNKGLFFMVFTVSSLLIRFVAGKTSDRYGRTTIIKIGLIVLIISLSIIGSFQSVPGLLTGSFIYGIATGLLSPATNAWTVDLSDPAHRGKAMATMYIALEVGIGIGALCSGWFYQDRLTMIPRLIFLAAGIAGLALLYLVKRRYNQRQEAH
ncbi:MULTISPECIES: MFS transporter [Olivibacter]|jgi:MFS family permease|uniref:Major facilitator superfamily MFS_1 n=2 Tax=Sphingobacteriaceae TaxID=84566 RepID=F4CF95_SPHS2|nr:MFS transporter [Olivibacter sp. UJ_SKK_5.1]MDX3917204.1 MFS transporter [Pseudosphingobacterium sp.]